MIDQFLTFMTGLPDGLVYFMLGLSAFVENIFPPIPGDTITAFGAFLVGTRRLSFWGVYSSTTLGSLLGFLCLFWVGRLLGRRFFVERDYRWFRAQDIRRAEAWFLRYGHFFILLNRFFPGLRSVISIAGGISGLNTLVVAVLAFVSCAVWNLIWILAGFMLGSNWDVVKGRMSQLVFRYNLAILGLLLVAGFLVLWRVRKR